MNLLEESQQERLYNLFLEPLGYHGLYHDAIKNPFEDGKYVYATNGFQIIRLLKELLQEAEFMAEPKLAGTLSRFFVKPDQYPTDEMDKDTLSMGKLEAALDRVPYREPEKYLFQYMGLYFLPDSLRKLWQARVMFGDYTAIPVAYCPTDTRIAIMANISKEYQIDVALMPVVVEIDKHMSKRVIYI